MDEAASRAHPPNRGGAAGCRAPIRGSHCSGTRLGMPNQGVTPAAAELDPGQGHHPMDKSAIRAAKNRRTRSQLLVRRASEAGEEAWFRATTRKATRRSQGRTVFDKPEEEGTVESFLKRVGRRVPFWASRGEMGPWEQKEGLRARIDELESILQVAKQRALADPERRAVARSYAKQARRELKAAERALAHNSHPTMRRAAHLGVAQSHVDSALNLMIWMAAGEDIRALLPQLVALVDEHLAGGDPRRLRVKQIARELRDESRPFTPSDRAFLAETASLARRLLRKETLRVRSFVRIVGSVTAGLSALAIAVVVMTFIWQDKVPLCFTPQIGGNYEIVCPTSSEGPTGARPPAARVAAAAQPWDYLVIEIVGLVAAAIAAAAALRRIRGTALPYNVPVVLALLKLPTGALTAVLGLLLMRGSFIPGLSALDSPAQIIAWAIVFGYSQQLLTKFVDARGQDLLDAVHGPQIPITPAPTTEVRL